MKKLVKKLFDRIFESWFMTYMLMIVITTVALGVVFVHTMRNATNQRQDLEKCRITCQTKYGNDVSYRVFFDINKRKKICECNSAIKRFEQ